MWIVFFYLPVAVVDTASRVAWRDLKYRALYRSFVCELPGVAIFATASVAMNIYWSGMPVLIVSHRIVWDSVKEVFVKIKEGCWGYLRAKFPCSASLE